MDKKDVDAMGAAHKAWLNLLAGNAVVWLTLPFVIYSAAVLALPRKP